MYYFQRIREVMALPLILSLLIGTFPVSTFAAGNVSTDQLIEESITSTNRAMIQDLMSRDEMREQMTLLGVDPDEALTRVNTLSDSEIQQIAGQITTLPAGGDALASIVGAAVTVFIILLITDLLCLTSFFSFTKCAR
jgi:hypothetical protein